MANIPKPDLERGNYLVYTDEPDTVIDSTGGGGGGGGVYFDAEYDIESETPSYTAKFSYNDVKNSVESGKIVCLRSVYTDPGSEANIIEIDLVSNLFENPDPVEYTVLAGKLSFTAADPDALMTYDDE